MAVVGSAQLLVVPTFKGLQKDVRKELEGAAGPAGKAGGKSLGASLTKWGKRGAIAAGAGVAAAATTALVKGFGRLTSIENAQAQLRGLGHDAKSVQNIMDNALAAVKGTAFGLDEAATTAATAVASGVKPGKDLEKYLTLTADAATLAGVSMGEMGDILNKVQAKNKVSAREINQMTERGVPIMSMLAEKYGVSAEAMTKMVSKGEVDAAAFRDALESNVAGAALESGNTTEGAFKNLGAAVGRVGANFLSGIFPKFKEGFTGITEFLGPIEDKAKVVGEALSTWLGAAAEKVQGFFSQISSGEGAGGRFMEFLRGVRDVGSEVWSWVQEHIVPALKTFGETVGGAVLGAVEWLWEKLQDLAAWFRDNEDQIRSVADVVGGVLHGAITKAGDVIAWVVEVGKGLSDWLIDHKPLVVAAAAAYGSWKLVMAGISFGKWAAGLAKTAAAWVKDTAATVANTVAKGKSLAETVALKAMYAGDFIRAQAKAIAGWARETAAMIANRVQVVAQTVARKAGSWATFLSMQARAIAGWIRETAVATAHRVALVAGAVATKAVTIAQRALNVVMRANPIGLVVTAIMLLVGAFVTAYKKSETFRKIVDAAWRGIKTAASAVWNFLKDKVFKPLGDFIGSIGTKFTKMKDGIASAWGSVKSALKSGWDFVKKWALLPFKVYIGVLKTAFDTGVSGIKTLWNGLKAPFKAAWTWINDNVLKKFKKGLENLRDNVSKIKDKIGDAWKGIANKFRNPINWVLDKVWNKGIAKAFNSAASALNLKLRLTTEAEIPKFAKGGRHKGGWAMVGEEGPEIVNFDRPGRIYTASQTAAALAAGRDLSPSLARRAAGGSPAEAVAPMGGWWNSVKSFGGSVKDGIVDAVSGAIKWVRGGLADAAAFLLQPIRSLIGSTVGQWGTMGRFAGDAMKYGMDKLIGWIGGKDVDEPPVIGGSGWKRPSRGPITSRFGPRWGSTHAGIDIAGGGPTYAAAAGRVFKTGWNILGGRTGIGIGLDHGGRTFTYYGHNPSMAAVKVRPGDRVKAGQHIGAQGATGNVTGTHVHFELHKGGWGRAVNPEQLGLFDGGNGWLKPGMLAYHSTRMNRPDAILSERQWDDIHRLAATRTSNPGPMRLDPRDLDRLADLLDRHARDASRRSLDETGRAALAGAGKNRRW